MFRFGRTKVAKGEFFGAKKTIKIWDVNVDNTVNSTLTGAKNNFKYLTGYLDDAIRTLVLILRKQACN